MKRSVRIAALIMALVMMFGVLSAGASSDKADKISLTLAVYKTFPASMTLEKGDTGEIKQVIRMQFRYSGLDSFKSVEKVLNNVSGSTLSKSGLKWVSSNEKVATAGTGGTIKAVKKGTAYIYPVPKGVTSYKYCGRFIIYLKVGVHNGVRLYGGIGTKVKVIK